MWWAAKHEEDGYVIELLLAREDIDLNFRDSYFRLTPLEVARRWNTKMATELLE